MPEATGSESMIQLQRLISAIVARRELISAERALLVGLSGIDGSGKGFVARRIAESLRKVALIGADGWLNLPHVRFARQACAEHFYRHALRLEEMFNKLVLPLRDQRSIDLDMDFTDEAASSYRRHRYRFRDVDIVLVEGIFLFQPQYRCHFDFTCWIDCSFRTALARAIQRRQEGLSPAETVRDFGSIYFPAQRLHLERDHPRAAADLILPNDGHKTALPAGESASAFVTSNLLPKP